jgi:hypothetical protein
VRLGLTQGEGGWQSTGPGSGVGQITAWNSPLSELAARTSNRPDTPSPSMEAMLADDCPSGVSLCWQIESKSRLDTEAAPLEDRT